MSGEPNRHLVRLRIEPASLARTTWRALNVNHFITKNLMAAIWLGQNPAPLVNIKIGGNQMDVPPQNGIARGSTHGYLDDKLTSGYQLSVANVLQGSNAELSMDEIGAGGGRVWAD